MKTTTKKIPLGNIWVDDGQPRKSMNADELKALALSIKNVGLLQPLVVLQHKKGKKEFMLICGERRLKALLKNKEKEAQCVIHKDIEPGSFEVREMQLIENMQRDNVHPMEESNIIQEMIEMDHDKNEIASRLAISIYKLNRLIALQNLIPEFQLAYKEGRFPKYVFDMAGIPQKQQEQMLKEYLEWPNNSDHTDVTYEFMTRHFNQLKRKLSNAIFGLDEKVGDLPLCNGCQFNSCTAVLFAQDGEEAICSNLSCLKEKTTMKMKLGAQEAIEEGCVLFANIHSYNFTETDFIKEVQNQGAKIELRNDFGNVVEKPSSPMIYNDWLADEYDGWDVDELPPESELKKEYAEYHEESETELKEYQEHLKNGDFVKVFVVQGELMGTYQNIMPYREELSDLGILKDSNQGNNQHKAEIAEMEAQIEKIKERKKRNVELDREKVFKNAFLNGNVYSELVNDYQAKDGELTMIEWQALVWKLYEVLDYSHKDKARKIMKKDFVQQVSDLKNPTWSEQGFSKLVRLLISTSFISQHNADAQRSVNPALMMAIGKEFFPKDIEILEVDQKGIADARNERADKKIATLQAKIKNLKSETKN